MIKKPFRNAALPRDLGSAETVVEIQGLEFPLIAEPARGIVTAFRVDFRGDPQAWKPGSVEVAATLVRKFWDEERKMWCRDRVEYQVRFGDLTPGRGGRASQLKPTDVYRLEFTTRPIDSTQIDLPTYDFSQYERIETHITATAADGTISRRRLTCDLASEACHEPESR